jgi:transcription-repair coupling factor (superfamily II helicase)
MVLPFVRELLADAEQTQSFRRAATLLKGPSNQTPPGRGGAERIRVSGLTLSAKALHIGLLHRASGKPLLVLVPDNRAAEELTAAVQAFCELTGAAAPGAIVHLPAIDVLPYENLSPHPEIQEKRAGALVKITHGEASIVVVPMAAAAMRLRRTEFYASLARSVHKGDFVDVEELVRHLSAAGYTRTDVVEMAGEYAVRGGILDVFPPEQDRPVRIETFGDEVESLRSFDPGTQRSSNAVEDAELLPLTETPIDETVLAAIHARLSGMRIAGAEELVERAISEAGVTAFPGWELYSPLAYFGEQQSIFALMDKALVAVDEPGDCARELEHWWERVEQSHERSGVGALARPDELFFTPAELQSQIVSRSGFDIEQLPLTLGENEEIRFASQPTPRFHNSVPAMAEEVRKVMAEAKRVLVCAGNTGEVERLADIFAEYGISFRLGTRAPRPGDSYVEETSYMSGELSGATLVKAYVPLGVALPDANLVIFGSCDLFDESEAAPSRGGRSKSKAATFMSDFRDLQVGDYVVHVEHGIGRYAGLKEIPQGDASDQRMGEFMVLEYVEGARLYVPLTRLDLVQKYRSAEGGIAPQLARLGSGQWIKTKARVKKAMQDMADELLKLYAQRKTAEGHAFPVDTEWQREFEDTFEFNETEDQLQAITDIKGDMQSQTPMDRLLCGDVGYGKTEVAMRAAFKAVSDNKQVAVLAPTTVLAFQHFETFKRRFAAFPIKIEMISRFRTTKEQVGIVERVEAGKVDILIGTHRLLSKDIKFPDLGLVVVDEEQRFGVRHKERLKQLKKEVDVLTMSATPIPRTLHMSLVGLRDMSVIETPPKDRMAIQTEVAAWDEKLIKSAIERELERQGQVYFVHNRVDSIYEIAAKIQELVPPARVIVGHGQMSEGELEKVMFAFMRHEYDVLVATTIIENGLDIPLCNTMIVNRADRHGLSELYQLRGRVGRSSRRAYAYLLVPQDVELTPVARRRLAALKEFSDLGAGFKIAALDLELRGAGNLLGGQQSGHIDAVGFELYTSMLERTIKEMKGEMLPAETETQLNLGLNIRIPNEYIAEENQRLRMYKRVAGVETEQQLGEVRTEMIDRYGPLPAAVETLFLYAGLKLVGQRVGVASVDRKRDQISIKFTEAAQIDPERLARFVSSERGAQFTPAGVLKFNVKSTMPDAVLTRVQELLTQLAALRAAAPAVPVSAS